MNSAIMDVLVSAAGQAHWAVLAGAVLMVLVWTFRKVTKDRLPVKWLPLVTQGLGLVVAVAEMLIADVVWWQALLFGVFVGGAASGFWSTLGKYILPAPAPEDPAPEDPAPEP